MTEPAELPCKEKLAFDTQKEANTAATVAELQRNVKLKSYRCRHCHLWHLATQQP